MKTLLLRLCALVLVAVIGLTGCSGGTSGKLTGDYRQDSLELISSLRAAVSLTADDPNKGTAEVEARKLINDFASRYRRDGSVTKLSSFTTIQTALNALAGHYSAYPNRPIPAKLKARLEQEFKQVESALRRGA